MNTKLFREFLTIAKALNRIGITPLLMGSLGLEYVTQKDWHVADIDIHVDGDPRGWDAPDEDRIYQFDAIQHVMEELGYVLIDKHEHEFAKGSISVEFGTKDSLPAFAGCALDDLLQFHVEETTFTVPTTEQYLKIYEASSKDGYRNDNNNGKDFEKIAFLTCLLDSSE